MRYEPREIKENVNVSSAHPLKELFVLLGGALGILVALYVVLGLAVDLVVPRLPAGIEESLGSMYSRMYKGESETEQSRTMQALLDSLTAKLADEAETHYSVHLVNSPVVNAMAVPGGNIVVFSGLINETESENELAFVLAHELGHFAGRDHLRGLGRGLVLMFISATVLGHDSDVTQFLMNSLVDVEMKFSQKQELQADRFALELLNRRYGHVAGSADFFQRLAEENEHSRLRYYFASHPHPQARVEALEVSIEDGEYPRGQKTPLGAVFLNSPGRDKTD